MPTYQALEVGGRPKDRKQIVTFTVIGLVVFVALFFVIAASIWDPGPVFYASSLGIIGLGVLVGRKVLDPYIGAMVYATGEPTSVEISPNGLTIGAAITPWGQVSVVHGRPWGNPNNTYLDVTTFGSQHFVMVTAPFEEVMGEIHDCSGGRIRVQPLR